MFTSESIARIRFEREWPLEWTEAQKAVAEVMRWAEYQGAPGLSTALMVRLQSATEALREKGVPQGWSVQTGGKRIAVTTPIRLFLIGSVTALAKLPQKRQLRRLLPRLSDMVGWQSSPLTMGRGQQPTVYHPTEQLDQDAFRRFADWVKRECSEAIEAECRLPELPDDGAAREALREVLKRTPVDAWQDALERVRREARMRREQ
ncbi:MAG: hypothetical protein ACE5JM_16290 [Armatimonadota bacterium]